MVLNEQQKFWQNEYAEEYIKKNSEFDLHTGIKGWSTILNRTSNISSVLECGCNIGRNINFLNHVLPNASKSIIEISPKAYDIVTNQYKIEKSFNGPILDSKFEKNTFDLTFTTGVLIHIHPDDLVQNMAKLFEYSNIYIVIGEYFNKTPMMLEYQGQLNKLFKCDFGKLFLENFNVKLVDYGFLWSHEYGNAGFDDITWWVFEKLN